MNGHRIIAGIVLSVQIGIMHPYLTWGGEPVEPSLPARLPPMESAGEMISAGTGGIVRLGNTEIEIPAGALREDTEIRISRLLFIEDTGETLKNVTRDGGGYRFEPAGTQFAIPATIRMGYEPGLPEGALETLYTYYYNPGRKAWEKLEKAGIEEGESRIVSLTTHFTDMINGTLSLPEGPSPLRFNINSIKGLEAANPSAGIPGIEGLEANNTGTAGFQIALDMPAGRGGMRPRAAVVYSSDAGNGLMGKGFELSAGGRITTDTRWGTPRFNGRDAGTGDFDRDTYVLEGAVLKEVERDTSSIRYTPEREIKYERIKRIIRDADGESDYWEVTDKGGVKRIYGKSDAAAGRAATWSGISKAQKYIWELELEQDVFGNTIRYEYEAGEGHPYLKYIYYTGDGDTAGNEPYRITFIHDGREDVRVDGRGGFLSKSAKRLKRIEAGYKTGDGYTYIRGYRAEYTYNEYGISLLQRFGQEKAAGSDAYLWSYGFEYQGLEGGGEKKTGFTNNREWGGINNGLQVQIGVNAGAQGSLSGGSGIGYKVADVRITGGGTRSRNEGTTETKQTLIDLNGDGRPDSVRILSGGLEVLENTGNGFRKVGAFGARPGNIGKERTETTNTGWIVGAGAAAYKYGAGVNYGETLQEGWTTTGSGFVDIDGDGLVDVINGSGNYYHNISEKEGEIRFEYIEIPVITTERIERKVAEVLNKEPYRQAYYQEAPLREWRAPYKGEITIGQRIQREERGSYDPPPLNDGLVARTYKGAENAAIASLFIASGRQNEVADVQNQNISEGESLYFVADAGEDPRGDDILWDITLEYGKVEYFSEMEKGIEYFPPETDIRSPEEMEGNILMQLYRSVKVSGVVDHYELVAQKPWELYFPDPWERQQAWERIVEFGWFIPGRVRSEAFKKMWDLAVSLDSISSTDLYRQDLITYYNYDAGTDAYILSKENHSTYAAQWVSTSKNVNMLMRSAGGAAYYKELAGMEWIDAKRVIPVPGSGAAPAASYHEGMVTGLTGQVVGELGYIYPADEGGQLILNKHEGSEWTADIENGLVYRDGGEVEEAEVTREGKKLILTTQANPNGTRAYRQIYTFEKYHRIREQLTANEIDTILRYQSLHNRGSEDYYTIGHERWQGELDEDKVTPVFKAPALSADDRNIFQNAFERHRYETAQKPPRTYYTYTLRSLSESKEAEVNRVLTAYGISLEFPYYEPDPATPGAYVLKQGYNADITDEALSSLHGPGLTNPLYRAYERILAMHKEFTLWYCDGTYSREIIYFKDGMYTPADGRIVIPVLDDEGFGPREFSYKRLTWNSGQDFSSEFNEPYTYLKEAKDEEGETHEITEGPIRAGMLPGGKNNWLYGIWFGSQTNDLAFSEEKLYSQQSKFEGQSQESIENSIKKKEKEIGDKSNPPEQGDPVYYMKAAPNEDTIEDYEYGIQIGQTAIIGTISYNIENNIIDQPDGSTVIEKTIRTYFPYIEGNRIHTTRTGGMDYYTIPGIMPRVLGTSGFSIGSLRHSQSKGTDKAWTGDLSIPIYKLAEFQAGLNNLLEDLNPVMLEGGFNHSTNTGESWMDGAVQDIDGDGIADMVGTGGSGLSVLVGSRKGFIERISVPGTSKLSSNHTDITTYGGSLSASGSVTAEHSGGGWLKEVRLNGGAGGSYAKGTSKQTEGLIDINGDGLPDYVSGSTIKLNLGRSRGFTGTGSMPGNTMNEGRTTSWGASLSLGVGTGGSTGVSINKADYTAGVNVGVGGGLNFSSSVVQTDYMLVDMNGDGLPDQVRWSGDENIEVRYNRGDRFTDAPVKFNVPDWNINDREKFLFTFTADGNLMLGVFEGLPLIGSFVDEVGLTDNLQDSWLINPIGPKIKEYLKSLEMNSTLSYGISASANAGGTFSISIYGIFLNLTVGAGGGFNAGTSINGVTMRMMDMNGDGLPDRVLRVPATDSLFVQLNTTGEVGLLKGITLPQGGRYDLGYRWEMGTMAMPQSRYVLSEVTRRDNNGTGGLKALPFQGKSAYTVKYTYLNGRYDRERREFYGFETVTTDYVEGDRILGRAVTRYENTKYYSAGMPLEVSAVSAEGFVYRHTRYTIDEAPYARNTAETLTINEPDNDGSVVETRVTYEYDAYGNVVKLEERMNGEGETIRARIEYWRNESRYIHRPLRIEVRGERSGLLRERYAVYDSGTGALKELRRYYRENGARKTSIHSIEWDAYGNMTRITDPAGSYTGYVYDELGQYVTEIRAGGPGISPYVSRMAWNKILGKKTEETDENGQKIRYEYDEYGRLKKVWSPYDGYGEEGMLPAVYYKYVTEAGKNWYTVTKNKVRFDRSNRETLKTIIMADGLGRAIYTGKQGAKWVSSGEPKPGWNVSGLQEYDGKGRVIAQGQPVFIEGEKVDAVVGWALGEGLVNRTDISYDELDREIKTILPGESSMTRPVQEMRYQVKGMLSRVVTKDPRGNLREQAADGRGNIVEVMRYNSQGKSLSGGQYRYNGLGELLEALDDAGNALITTYDELGRMKSMESGDIGKKEYWYDGAGNLAEESDNELRKQGKRIRYEYDGLNRLVKINYPRSGMVVYEYGATGAAYNAAGRVTKVRDETGTTAYKYGLLGQVEEETRMIKTLPLSRGEEKTMTMKYRSDYLGRMEWIRYEDGEEVEYKYDWGGQITNVTGRRNGHEFRYVKEIGYDEYGQRVYVEYGNGVKTRYAYDPYRRWLKQIRTESPGMGNVFQDIEYGFDEVGNVAGYTNRSAGYTTAQEYGYDGLDQLIRVRGEHTSHPYGGKEYYSDYTQEYRFDRVGNMTGKVSEEYVDSTNRVGMNLNYALDYEYYGGTHRAKRIGTRYYDYDGNGNVTAEREGGHASAGGAGGAHPLYEEGGLSYTDYGFGLTRTGSGGTGEDGVYQRNYRWNERNLMTESLDGAYSVHYRYGADGERAVKYNATNGKQTLYFNSMWQMRNGEAQWVQSKHIYVGETRIGTKYNSEGNANTGAEAERIYYYHGDHLGSAQVITNYAGQLYERLEYTPYGETWIEWRNPGVRPEETTPYRFTGKEQDEETGLYYYGARYLDPKTSRWLSGDPALGEYLPGAPVSDEARQRNGNLPGQGGVFNLVNLHVYHYAGNNPVKYVDPDGKIIKAFTSSYKQNEGDWKNNPVGNSSDIEKNYMRKIGCAVTGLANAINTLLGVDKKPSDINKSQYFPTTGNDNNKSDIYFDQVASDNNLSHSIVWGNFSSELDELKQSSKDYVVLAFVKYANDSNAGHYVGVNDTKKINGIDYIEISPTSTNDSNSSARRDSWVFSDNKVYVPLSDIKRLDVLSE
jgi:RHS repeat-associated protein